MLGKMVAVQMSLSDVLDDIFDNEHALVPEGQTLGDYYNYEINPYNPDKPIIKLYEGSWLIGQIAITIGEIVDRNFIENNIYDMLSDYINK